MDLNEASKLVKQVLSKERYEHTLRVHDTALKIGEKYGESEDKIRLAALLHDYAKCFTIDKLKGYIYKYDLPKSLLDYHFELWHGPAAAKIMEKEYGIADEDVLNAIYYHTTGRMNMTKLEYIIFVADYIEPCRNFEGVEEVRILAKTDLRKATRKALKNTIMYLMQKDAIIHPDTFLSYNMLTETLKER